jgi:ATP-binding cassette subfamily B protein
MEVLQKAAVNSLLARADRGLDTVIGEGGVKVSGGEKQRLSIARALLRHPQLLVFDEATSSLDSLTEEEVSRTIREVATNQEAITILIAHRLSTIMHADRIYVLERGRIVESGAHSQFEEGLHDVAPAVEEAKPVEAAIELGVVFWQPNSSRGRNDKFLSGGVI